MDLTSIEKQILGMLLAGEDPQLQILRQQVAACSVSKRELSGVGFFTHLHVPDQVTRLATSERIQLSDVVASMDGLELGAGFVLFIENGTVDLLEGFCFEESWPDQVSGLELRYESGEPGGRVLPRGLSAGSDPTLTSNEQEPEPE